MADESASWTIKSMPVDVRHRAVKAAHAQDQTMAEWLVDAVTRLADQQAGNRVIPPGKPAQERRPVEMPDIDLTGLAEALNATVAATQASGDTPPKSLGRDAAATLRRYMRAARGLPARQTRGQTKLENRQTLPAIAVTIP